MPARFLKSGLIVGSLLFTPAAANAQQSEAAAPVEVGLDARLRYELTDPTGFGSGPQDSGGYLLWRVAPKAEIAIAPEWRAHVELFAAGELGRNGGARANDRNDLDLTQAYIEWRHDPDNYVRVGRQEMALGSGRLLAAFDGANVRRRFDGALGQVRTGDVTIVGIAASPVLVQPGTFDDNSSFDRLAVGAGVIQGEANRNGVALYAIRTQSFAPLFGAMAGRQERFTIGVRGVRTTPRLFLEGEVLGQLGNAAFGRHVRAWAVAGEVRASLTRLANAQILVGTKFSIASGDSNRSDQRITGFDPLFPNPVFTGSFPIFAPTNMASINPALSLQWQNGNRIGIDVAVMQRLSRNDQLYTFGGMPIRLDGSGRAVGNLWALTGSYRITPQMSANGAVVLLDQGDSFLPQQRDTFGAFLNLSFSL